MQKDMPAYSEIVKKIVSKLPCNGYMLEIATGTGAIALEIAEHVKSIEAVDISPKMIEIAKKKAQDMGILNINFSVQDACSLPYDKKSFDAVIISNTLHIMPCPDKALEEIKRVLKKGGILFAPTFVHANSLKAKILSRLVSVTGFKAYHKWTKESYCDYIEANGFDIIESAMIKASFPLAYVCACIKS
jgi:ubiquinone/menaquinone biosynthesis C-methylase UbiE